MATLMTPMTDAEQTAARKAGENLPRRTLVVYVKKGCVQLVATSDDSETELIIVDGDVDNAVEWPMWTSLPLLAEGHPEIWRAVLTAAREEPGAFLYEIAKEALP